MVASSYTLAAAVCALAVSWLGMPLGRRGCVVLGDILVVIGGSLQASSWSVGQIIAGRVLCVYLTPDQKGTKPLTVVLGIWNRGLYRTQLMGF